MKATAIAAVEVVGRRTGLAGPLAERENPMHTGGRQHHQRQSHHAPGQHRHRLTRLRAPSRSRGWHPSIGGGSASTMEGGPIVERPKWARSCLRSRARFAIG
jgi:hypothetical protein